MLTKILDYLRYPSTYQGLVALLTVLGVNVAPDLASAITTIGVTLFGFIALKFSDSDVKKKK